MGVRGKSLKKGETGGRRRRILAGDSLEGGGGGERNAEGMQLVVPRAQIYIERFPSNRASGKFSFEKGNYLH